MISSFSFGFSFGFSFCISISIWSIRSSRYVVNYNNINLLYFREKLNKYCVDVVLLSGVLNKYIYIDKLI